MTRDMPLPQPVGSADVSTSSLPQLRAHGPADAFDKHLGAVFRYLSLRLNDLHAVEDLSSQCFLRLVEQYDSLAMRSPNELKFWLLRTAGNLAKEYLRNRRRRQEVPFHSAFERPAVPGIEIQKLDWPVLYKAILELPQHYQEVMMLRYIEEYEICETAQILGKRETTVRSLLHRACKKLHNLLSDSLGD